jgi:hypothetical protein
MWLSALEDYKFLEDKYRAYLSASSTRPDGEQAWKMVWIKLKNKVCDFYVVLNKLNGFG